MIASVLVMLLAPYFIGEWLGRRIRMPDYGWKIGLILTAIVAGVTIDYFRWPPKLGIDLSGGVKLIYQLDQGKLRSVNVDQLLQKMADAANATGFGSKKAEVHPLDEGRLEVKLPTEDPAKVQQASDAISRLDFQNLGITVRFISSSPSNGNTTLIYQADHRADAVDMNKLINAVVKRVNPGGQREVAIRRVGSDQIEVAIPDVDKAEIEQIKEKIATAGASSSGSSPTDACPSIRRRSKPPRPKSRTRPTKSATAERSSLSGLTSARMSRRTPLGSRAK